VYNRLHIKLYSLDTPRMWCSESKPACRTNISRSGNLVDASDHIEIVCSVTFNGLWTPVFICAPDSPGTNTTINNQTSSSHVTYRRVIAAADVEDLAVLNCYMTFTLTTDSSVRHEQPVYDFIWNTTAIHIVNASGKCHSFYTLYTAIIF